MRSEDISNAFNEIDEEYIESANKRRKIKSKTFGWVKWVSVAAVFAVVAFIGIKVFVPVFEPEQNDNPIGTVGGTETE